MDDRIISNLVSKIGEMEQGSGGCNTVDFDDACEMLEALVAGAPWRSKIRRNLEKAKADILYETKSGYVELVENKSFLESEFTFVVTNLTDAEALVIQKSFKEYFAKLKAAIP